MARWQLETPSYHGTRPYRQLQLLETVTDRGGYYSFPWWGPRLAIKGRLPYRDPQIVFFKSRYHVVRKHNEYSRYRDYRAIRKSKWDGKTIVMERFTGTSEEFKRHLELSALSILDDITDDNGPCALTKLPRLLRALRRDSDRLASDGVSPPYGAETDSIQRLKQCPSAPDFFVEYWR